VDERTPLREIAALFARLGATAFGGPAVHLSLMHQEVVRKRKWLTEESFLDLLSATNLIPGPNSTEMALHIGWQRRGLSGLLTAGLCFIGPAMLITMALAWVYVRWGSIPSVAWLLYGVKPVMLAVVLQAIWSLAPKAVHSLGQRGLALLALGAMWLGVHELLVLLGIGVLSVCAARISSTSRSLGSLLAFLPLPSVAAASTVSKLTIPSLSSLFWVFLKTGSVLYGSGYVLLAFLRADLVDRLGWLTESQLIDAIAVGQITPGPVLSTATFLGYLLAGPKGALLATVGIFAPAFVLVALSGPLIPVVRRVPVLASFLDGVNVASWVLMVFVTLQLGRAALGDLPALGLFALSVLLLLRFRTHTTWLLVCGAGLGWLLHQLGLSSR